MTKVFLHGLESSSKGRKARWFAANFPAMIIPDFVGSLEDRLLALAQVVGGRDELLLVGSSFGGLQALAYSLQYPGRVSKMVLLAPALNFPEFAPWRGRRCAVETHLYIGSRDEVCPPAIVVPEARAVIDDLRVRITDDDHLLRDTFAAIDWRSLLSE